MKCPKCGYVMTAFEAECPRCARRGAQTEPNDGARRQKGPQHGSRRRGGDELFWRWPWSLIPHGSCPRCGNENEPARASCWNCHADLRGLFPYKARQQQLRASIYGLALCLVLWFLSRML